MNSFFRPNCPKCGKEMYYNMFLKTTEEQWHVRWDDDELNGYYEGCYEVSFNCYNEECKPKEDDI
tara:strand:+ start:527 stop:721 length:195 start_codon:yes stop_codon:yes gene_type:complete